MFLKGNHVINPPKYLTPHFSISPYSCNRHCDLCVSVNNSALEAYLNHRFGVDSYEYTQSGRAAIEIMLQRQKLSKSDNVAIITTTGKNYISRCVTIEIEKYCKWSRCVDNRTRLIFIIHEFGFPLENIQKYKKYGLPIVEDLAYSFFSNNNDRSVGKIGDYLIFSLPKMFPIQLGGLLISRFPFRGECLLDNNVVNYIKSYMGRFIASEQLICENRRKNYKYLEERFKALGCSAYFAMNDYHVPGVFMFKTDPKCDLGLLKIFFQRNGVESSVFYPENAFFVPVHQDLSECDLDYFVTLAEIIMESKHGII